MINPGYSLTLKDKEQLLNFKKRPAYSSYLKGIASSPAYIAIIQEHITNIDISDDIRKLKSENKLPEGVKEDSLSDLFKSCISKMTIPLVADTILLRETEEIKIDKVLSGLEEDNSILYLMGMAEEKYYERADEMVKKGQVDETSLVFRGLMAYKRKTKKKTKKPETRININTPKKKQMVNDEPKQDINIHSDNIEI